MGMIWAQPVSQKADNDLKLSPKDLFAVHNGGGRWSSDNITFSTEFHTIPLKIRRVWGLLHSKLYVVAKRPPVGVARKVEEVVPAQYHPRHLSAVQNNEVRPKIALFCFKSGR
ncbi:hypothetical protein AVEN_115088-1 [Araneus ventricosus]|uniref:Uncharacterized protein n=1 Tax=Araneus ventricosus TaxID=182803 RepID=A0A4Y1ZYE1_ARAVE|nr:hypothetical protein AVEN_115088-1 [Araneus ventricosus]